MTVLFILQNAYQSKKYNFRNDEEWFRDLNRSYTGKRLKEMIPDGYDIAVINSSPIIGDNANSCFDADLQYITKKINEIKPSVICACGRIAQSAMNELGLKHIAAPHPAWRAFSKEHAKKIKNKIKRKL